MCQVSNFAQQNETQALRDEDKLYIYIIQCFPEYVSLVFWYLLVIAEEFGKYGKRRSVIIIIMGLFTAMTFHLCAHTVWINRPVRKEVRNRSPAGQQ